MSRPLFERGEMDPFYCGPITLETQDAIHGHEWTQDDLLVARDMIVACVRELEARVAFRKGWFCTCPKCGRWFLEGGVCERCPKVVTP